MADDWEYLAAIDRASGSPAVLFEVLAGRFVRPAVVLLYYGGYTLFGLWAPPVHIVLILIHSVNAWMLSAAVQRLTEDRHCGIGIAAGALFLSFAGHSEAVTWLGGAADVLVAFSLLGMLLVLERALGGPRGLLRLQLVLLLTVALLSKESAVVLPAILAMHAWVRRVELRAIAGDLLACSSVVVLFFLGRTVMYGLPTAAYAGLGEYAGTVFAHFRALVTRSFVPPSTMLNDLWLSGRDAPWFLVGIGCVVVAAVRGRGRALSFCVGALLIALAPTWPLSISLATSESERMLYVPSVFATAITALTLDALLQRSVLMATIVCAVVVTNGALLQRMNLRWVEAAEVFNGVTASLVDLARRHDPGRQGLWFVLSMPDNVRGAYVFRRGFQGALRFVGSDIEARSASLILIESQTMRAATDSSMAKRVTSTEYRLDISPNMFLSVAPPARPFFEFTEWTRTRYALRFAPTVRAASVFHVSGTGARFLGTVTGPGAPFGSVDLPAEGATCQKQIRFAGWALDDEEVKHVIALREVETQGIRSEIGEVTWVRNTRPDVAAAYASFPNTDRAEWNFHLSCRALGKPGEFVRVRIVALDFAGNRTEIGARLVRIAE